jgi:hypothetical protein
MRLGLIKGYLLKIKISIGFSKYKANLIFFKWEHGLSGVSLKSLFFLELNNKIGLF